MEYALLDYLFTGEIKNSWIGQIGDILLDKSTEYWSGLDFLDWILRSTLWAKHNRVLILSNPNQLSFIVDDDEKVAKFAFNLFNKVDDKNKWLYIKLNKNEIYGSYYKFDNSIKLILWEDENAVEIYIDRNYLDKVESWFKALNINYRKEN